MNAEKIVQAVGAHLFPEEGGNLFAVLDGASLPGLLSSLDAYRPESLCLFRGELKPDVAEVAPYLVALRPESDFAEWLIEQGWGRHCGIFAAGEATMQDMRRHFRSFLTVHDEDGKPLLFRYYDPRVLRLYLPTCSAEELSTVFGPVQCYLLEHEDPGIIIRFRLSATGTLRTELHRLSDGDYQEV